MMRKIITKWFKKWSSKVDLDNQSLIAAIDDIESGLPAVSLGKNLYKIRVSRLNAGKSTGFRTLLIYKKKNIAIFVYGFAKNTKANIDKKELRDLQSLGNDLLSLTEVELNKLVVNGILSNLEEA